MKAPMNSTTARAERSAKEAAEVERSIMLKRRIVISTDPILSVMVHGMLMARHRGRRGNPYPKCHSYVLCIRIRQNWKMAGTAWQSTLDQPRHQPEATTMDGAMPATAPRVNKKSLSAHVGGIVALVGAVERHAPDAVLLRTSDGQTVNVKPQPGSDYSSKVVEVLGRVIDGDTIEEYKTTLFGENFDLDSYDQLVQLAQGKYRALFQ